MLERAVHGWSVWSDSLWHHGLQPVGLLFPWDFPGKNTEWVTISSPWGSSQSSQSPVSYIDRQVIYHYATWEALVGLWAGRGVVENFLFFFFFEIESSTSENKKRGKRTTTPAESESHSVMSDSLQTHGLYSPWSIQSVVCTFHGILQSRTLEWGDFPFSSGSSQPREQAQVSRMAGGSLPGEPQGKAKNTGVGSLSLLQQICLTQHRTRVSSVAGEFFTSWAIRDRNISHCCSVAQWCPTRYNLMDCSMLGFSVLHYILEFAQTHVHWGNDAIQPSHPLSLRFPPALKFP